MDITVIAEGQVITAGQEIGVLNGLVFTPADTDGELEAKAINQAAEKALTPEIDRRLTAIAGSGQGAIKLSDTGEFLWDGAPIGKLAIGEALLKPKVELLCGEIGTKVLRDAALGRLADFIRLEISQKLAMIFALRDFAEDPKSYKDARALAHMLYENNGSLDLRTHHKLVKDTPYDAKSHLVGVGAVFGFFYAYMRDLMKPASARLLSILYVYAWMEKHRIEPHWAEKRDDNQPAKPFFPANGLTSAPAIEGYSEDVLNMAGYTRRGPRFIRFDIMNRLGKMLQQVRRERPDGRFVIKKEMLSLLGCSLEDLEKVLEALKYRKTTQKFTEEEAKAHKEYILAYFARRDAIRKAKEQGTLNPEDFPPVIEPKPALTTDKTHPDYKPKRVREKILILNDHVPKPEEDEDGNPVFETHLVLWAFGRSNKVASRYRPSKHGSNDPDKGGDENASGSAEGKPQYAHARKKNLTDYEKFANSTKQASANKPAKRQNKRRKPAAPQQTSWAPPKQQGNDTSSASPFAALASLKFEDDKKDKPKSKAQPKPKSKPKTKPKEKDDKA